MRINFTRARSGKAYVEEYFEENILNPKSKAQLIKKLARLEEWEQYQLEKANLLEKLAGNNPLGLYEFKAEVKEVNCGFCA